MDKNLLQKAKAPMIALIQTKNIMNNNLKNKTKRAAALLLLLGFLLPLAALAQSRDCNGPIAITDDAPYTQGFEDGVLPDCWDVYATEGFTAPDVYYDYSHSGSYSLRFEQGTNYAVLPEFNIPLNLLQIRFWIFGRGDLQLGYITAEDDGTCNTFTAIADYTATIDWVQYTNYLLNVPTTAHRLAFKSICNSAVSVFDLPDHSKRFCRQEVSKDIFCCVMLRYDSFCVGSVYPQ